MKGMKSEDKKTFAERVIRLADMFSRYPSQYDSLIQSYWESCHKSMALEEFLEACNQLTREKHSLPVPKEILDLVYRTRTGNRPAEAEEADPQQLHDEKVLFEGRGLLQVMGTEEKERTLRMARVAVLGDLGDFAESISDTKIEEMVYVRAAQMAWSRENKEK